MTKAIGRKSGDIFLGQKVFISSQIFIDGNKRASVIFANHYLISHGQGFLVIPEEHVPEFKQKLVAFYEGGRYRGYKSFFKRKMLADILMRVYEV